MPKQPTERIEIRTHLNQAHNGHICTRTEKGYTCSCGRWILADYLLRRGWGVVFFPAPGQEEFAL